MKFYQYIITIIQPDKQIVAKEEVSWRLECLENGVTIHGEDCSSMEDAIEKMYGHYGS